MCNQIISAGSFSSSERWKQVRPARSFGSSKALKPLVYQQSHAIQVLMKIDGGKYSMGGAIDVFDLAAGGQLIITPLYLVCVHPRSPKHALWSLPMREILFAEIATPEDEKNLRDFVEEEVYDRNVWVILSCCSSSQAAEEASRRASIISSGSGPINKKTGAFRSYIVQFTSERSAQRLQRVLHDMFELHSSRIAFKI
ncbi:hypothetical protein GUITHDRAFT_151157 [Guillardia theta CCMP2712]|uniref:Uncharacterized protein n=1 Tax=Guillardia theta (strain CCMP2712) TaxID=905079 RepID=L1JPT2_GUITC|nr:hypothetical protein GUITHDRAFT_151157 [Guillardia theta CCMP2712]EKX50462.1 hypothetical protein GUITHDRAFT_151157 [Guillardia theta CCMP2712]|eukprot:XP_005837442.1 hypothetical protein GUITHDRAFT_151157 [Guillardia theta CCMP2712]